jgi:hypothetical protein
LLEVAPAVVQVITALLEVVVLEDYLQVLPAFLLEFIP